MASRPKSAYRSRSFFATDATVLAWLTFPKSLLPILSLPLGLTLSVCLLSSLPCLIISLLTVCLSATELQIAVLQTTAGSPCFLPWLALI